MRKLWLLVLVFAFAAGSAMAQTSNLKNFFDGQHNKKGVTQITLNADIAIKNENTRSDIKGLKVLSFDSEDAEISCNDFMTEAFKALEADGFVQVMTMDHETEKVGVYLLNDKEGNNEGAAFTVAEEDEAVITWIEGKIDFSEMASMMGDYDLDINIEGFDVDGQ